jgi:hypothetical protein
VVDIAEKAREARLELYEHVIRRDRGEASQRHHGMKRSKEDKAC